MVQIWPYGGVSEKNIFDKDYLKTLASQFLSISNWTMLMMIDIF
jgi:hypothetical protein